MDSQDSPTLKGLIRLSSSSEQVLDADEEVFVLYSTKSNPSSGSTQPRGLGYLDSRADILTLSFEIKSHPHSQSTYGKRKSKSKVQDKTLEIQLAQDKTALRTRTGDTGSVVWRASIDFAQMILEQQHTKSPVSLLNEKLKDARVLELGSGTGLLSIALSPLVGQYTATDIAELVPLIRKNLTLNFSGWPHTANKQETRFPGHNVCVEELNWETLHSVPPHRRPQVLPLPSSPLDLILVVDCIYHPSLLPPLHTAMDYLTTPGTTAVLVVMELRAEDVTRDFLEQWLALDDGKWEVWRVGEDQSMGTARPYVIWVGWKNSPAI
ncbi:putative methyltransferase-domain-containing protein [Favolaschia claudopus]|uniref:Methyltransferase-domain-containing protein n=1 Tax=Favolaschia claudopus TaxID=2862362 RepID=A0AAV9ZTV7_9AGAR